MKSASAKSPAAAGAAAASHADASPAASMIIDFGRQLRLVIRIASVLARLLAYDRHDHEAPRRPFEVHWIGADDCRRRTRQPALVRGDHRVEPIAYRAAAPGRQIAG